METNRIANFMEKKNYSSPTCKVVVLDMNDIVCDSPLTNTDGENNPFSMGGRSSGTSRANSRNDIWDED
jgi:hypothetical protein